MLKEQLLREKRLELSKGAPSHQGLISCLLSIPGEGNAEVLYEEEIIRNVLLMPKGWQEAKGGESDRQLREQLRIVSTILQIPGLVFLLQLLPAPACRWKKSKPET